MLSLACLSEYLSAICLWQPKPSSFCAFSASMGLAIIQDPEWFAF